MPADRAGPELDLAELIAPIALDPFFDRYWTRRTLAIQKRGPARYARLPQIDDVEHLLASLTAPQAGWFSIVKTRARPPDDAMLGHDGLLNLAEVFAAYRTGHSLLLNQVQRRHRATGRLCRRIEAALVERGVMLAKNIGANAYLSPPRSQGFAIHYDPHDVFILQLAGHKAWRLYRQYVKFPTKPPLDPISAATAGPPTRELVLSPGDLVYIPRGVLHEAFTDDEPSLHLTLSVEVVTWRDLFAELLAADPRYGEGLPAGFARGAPSAADRARLRELARMLPTSRALPAGLARLGGRLLGTLDPLPTGRLERIDDARALRADTWLTLAEGAIARVQVDRDSATLQLPGAAFRAGSHMAPVFRLIARGRRFRPRDLPLAVSAAEKLAFARELYAGGHLVCAEPPPGDAGRRRRTRAAGARE